MIDFIPWRAVQSTGSVYSNVPQFTAVATVFACRSLAPFSPPSFAYLSRGIFIIFTAFLPDLPRLARVCSSGSLVMDSVYDLRSKRRLFVDKDIRLSDSVRNIPTAATPPQPLPQPPQDKEPAGLAEIRATFFELSDRVAKLYNDDKDKTIAKDIRSDVLGGKHVRFRAT